MSNELNLVERYGNPTVLTDVDLCSDYQKIKAFQKDVDNYVKRFEDEFSERTQGQTTIIGNYGVEYKSSNLFDKGKALEYAQKTFSEDEFKTFLKLEMNYKALQNHIKDIKGNKEYKEHFVKKSAPRLVLKRLEE